MGGLGQPEMEKKYIAVGLKGSDWFASKMLACHVFGWSIGCCCGLNPVAASLTVQSSRWEGPLQLLGWRV